MEGEAEELTDILDLTDEAPIIRWVNSLMFNAVKERASRYPHRAARKRIDRALSRRRQLDGSASAPTATT